MPNKSKSTKGALDKLIDVFKSKLAPVSEWGNQLEGLWNPNPMAAPPESPVQPGWLDQMTDPNQSIFARKLMELLGKRGQTPVQPPTQLPPPPMR